MCKIKIKCYKNVVIKNNVYNNIYQKPYLLYQQQKYKFTDTLIAKTNYFFNYRNIFKQLQLHFMYLDQLWDLERNVMTLKIQRY